MSGKKIALVISCSYIGTSNQLSGTLRDANNMLQLLKNLGYKGYDGGPIVQMTDVSPSNSLYSPTYENILTQLKNVLTSTGPGDDAFIFYAGHGVQTLSNNALTDYPDFELSGKDSAIVPIDFTIISTPKGNDFGNVVADDIFNLYLRNHSRAGARIFMMFDCCHSGTMCDLKYAYNCNTSQKPEKITMDVSGNPDPKADAFDKKNPIKAQVITFSACQDKDVSYESVIDYDGSNASHTKGVLTSAFIYAVSTGPTRSSTDADAAKRDVFKLLIDVQYKTTKNAGTIEYPKLSSNLPLFNGEYASSRYVFDTTSQQIQPIAKPANARPSFNSVPNNKPVTPPLITPFVPKPSQTVTVPVTVPVTKPIYVSTPIRPQFVSGPIKYYPSFYYGSSLSQKKITKYLI
jgi:hypothetical protein